MEKDLVLDASVALKWFIDEDQSYEARRLVKLIKQGKISVYVPPIFPFEVANILSLKENISPESLFASIGFLYSLNLRSGINSEEFLVKSATISKDFKITVYDASYIALAQDLKIDFLTADKKLKDKVKLSFIKLL